MKYNYPKLISCKVHNDNRGYLQEIYKRKDFKNNFKFAILASSKKNVFRGPVFGNILIFKYLSTHFLSIYMQSLNVKF